MCDTQRKGRLHRQEYLSQMGKYSLADILGHGGVNQSPHITNKFTRTGGTIIIRPLTEVLIVAAGGGAVTVVKGKVEGVVQVVESEAKTVDAEILMTCRAS